jgi:hypothetical protein
LPTLYKNAPVPRRGKIRALLCLTGETRVPRILIELSDDEYQTLRAAAKRDRRTAQAQAAQLLVDVIRQLTEADRAPLGAGGGLPPQQDVGAEQGHGDGPAAGVDQVVVGRPGEPE